MKLPTVRQFLDLFMNRPKQSTSMGPRSSKGGLEISSKVQQQCPGSLEKVSCQPQHRWSLTDGGYFACPRPSSDISHVLPCPPTQHLSSFTIPWASTEQHCGRNIGIPAGGAICAQACSRTFQLALLIHQILICR